MASRFRLPISKLVIILEHFGITITPLGRLSSPNMHIQESGKK
jgi:hypothetical protein